MKGDENRRRDGGKYGDRVTKDGLVLDLQILERTDNMQNRARKYAHHCDKIVKTSISFMIIACYHMILPN